jgi:hypothetical protein
MRIKSRSIWGAESVSRPAAEAQFYIRAHRTKITRKK